MLKGTWCRTGCGRFFLIVVNFFVLTTPSLASPVIHATIKAVPAVAITTTQLTDGKRGMAYSQQLAATGGTPPYTWSVESGNRLPMGFKLDPAKGIISGYPVREGSTVTTLRVTDSEGNSANRSYSLDVLLLPGELLSWSPGAPPTHIDGVDGIIAASEGDAHYAALKYDGTVWTWGDNSGNQLGGGGGPGTKRPIPGIANAVAISAGKEHTTVLTAEGTVKEFGNYWGSPRSFANTGFIALSGGDYYTVALKDDGTVWTWLYDHTPRQLIGFPKIAAIAAGRSYLGGTPDLALAEDGTVWTWTFKTPIPARLSSPTDVIAIANSNGAYLLKADGTVHGTTLNGAIAVGESGTIKTDGSVWYNPYKGNPTRVNGLNGVTAITRTTALAPYNATTLRHTTLPITFTGAFSSTDAQGIYNEM